LSTNYYYRKPGDAMEQHDDNHVGLSAGGLFTFQAYPARGITTFQSLLKFLQESESEIFNEYDEVMPLSAFVSFVTQIRDKSCGAVYANSPVLTADAAIKGEMHYRDKDGHLFSSYIFS
jgi:hypothetical protein